MTDIVNNWNRIISWLESGAPQVLQQHQPGVNATQLESLEKILNVSLPDELKQFYQLVNGDDPNKATSGIFPSIDDFDQMAYGPLALSKLQFEWETQNELLEGGDFEGCEPEKVDPGILNESWNPGWIPFAGNGGGDLYCVDLVPDDKGSVGQIISHNHETLDHRLLANSLGAYLEKLADSFESGDLKFSNEWGVCVKI